MDQTQGLGPVDRGLEPMDQGLGPVARDQWTRAQDQGQGPWYLTLVGRP